VFLWGLQKWVKWGFWFERCFGSNFIWFWSSLSVWKCWVNSGNQIWDGGVQNWDFWMKNVFSWQPTVSTCHGEYAYSRGEQYGHREPCLPATASKATRYGEHCVTWGMFCPPRRANHLGGELPQFQFFCFAFCVLFTYSCFELTLGMNMKVFKGFINLPMAPNWFENTLWILIYDENPSSESWWIWRSYCSECIYVCGLNCDWWTHIC